MDAVAYTDSAVISFVTENLVPLRIMADDPVLRSQFKIKWTPSLLVLDSDGIEHYRTLGFYPPEDLARIVHRSAGILRVRIEAAGAEEIARRSRGTPRIANRLLRRVRDFAEVKADGVVTVAVAAEALARLNVDEFGLDDMDARILTTIIEKFGGGPVGLGTIAAAVSEDAGTLEEVYEPYLLQQGFLERTPRGRVATPIAYRRFDITPPKKTDGGQAALFDA